MRPSPILLVALAPLVLPGSSRAQEEDRAQGLPLESERTIEFTTDEGTWISLDVTPDGRTVVFELLGDLYRVPIEGGAAERITEGVAFDAQPRVSPDGERIAFVSDRDGADNVWVSAIDGSNPRKLSSERQNGVLSPTWTPDGEYVIASVEGRRTDLRMYHVEGGTGVTLGGSADSGGGPGPAGGGGSARAELGAVVSPDGRFVYFAQANGAARGQFPRWQVARRDLVTGDVDVLTQAEGSAIRPALSPDGRLLVYATRHETGTGLRVRDLATGEDRWLAYPVQRDEQETGGIPSRDLFPGYAFTPDGTAVVVTREGRIERIDVATGAASPIPFEARVSLELGPRLDFPYRVPDREPVRARLVQDPKFSPDGRVLVFSVLTRLYRMELPDGVPRLLTPGDAWEFKPTWSPDGRWIAYVTWTPDGGHVWRIRSDGRGAPERLTESRAFYTDIAYSPDGTRLVGLRGNAYMRTQTFSEFGGLRIPLDLVWLPAEGGEVRTMAYGRGLGAPHFGPEPDRVYVYTREGLVSMRYDGTDRRTHLKVTGPSNPRAPQPPPAEAIVIRPDGRWALASVANQLFVVAVPRTGGDVPSVSVRSPSVPARRVTDIGADYFGWADGGDALTWAIGSTVFRREFSSVDFREASDSAGSEPGSTGEEPDAADSPEAVAEPPEALDEGEDVRRIDVRIEVPRARPSGAVALVGATLITMRGDEVIADGVVVVRDNRIEAVGASGSVSIPGDVRRIDVTGKWIVPGFVDPHAHWEFRTHDVLEPHNWSLVANLAYGVTAGLDVQTSTNDYFAYQDLVETGQSLGQRAFMTGPGVFSGNDFRSYDATYNYLRRYRDHYRTPNIKSYAVGNRQQRQWVAKASGALGLMPTTEGAQDLKLDLTHAIDGFHGNEHTLPVTPVYRDVAELYARSGIGYTPTLLVQYGGPQAEEYFFTGTEVHDDPKLNRFYPHNRLDEMTRRRSIWVREDEFNFQEAAEAAARIQRAGGLVGIGGHGEVQGLGYHWEMWAMASGMTNREVLQAATIDGARIIGFQEDLGSIESGKLADLVVLEADPLTDIHNTASIVYVMKNGDLFDGGTLDQIWPVERPLPPFWWWTSGSAGRSGAP